MEVATCDTHTVHWFGWCYCLHRDIGSSQKRGRGRIQMWLRCKMWFGVGLGAPSSSHSRLLAVGDLNRETASSPNATDHVLKLTRPGVLDQTRQQPAGTASRQNAILTGQTGAFAVDIAFLIIHCVVPEPPSALHFVRPNRGLCHCRRSRTTTAYLGQVVLAQIGPIE